MGRRFFLLSFLAGVLAAQEAVPQRYIVQIEGDPAITAADRSAGRARVAARQNAVRTLLRTARAQEVASVTTVLNALIVDAPDGSDALLAALPGVRRVTPVKELKLSLDAALAAHAVPQAWDRIGGIEKAGEGVRIGILDTGIDPEHPAFALPEGLKRPESYLRSSGPSNDRLLANPTRVIVARSYDSFGSAYDLYGHGTAVAAAAAGTSHMSPRGPISGVAPYAWIGAYKVSRSNQGSIPTDFILLALDDAANDGMQVLNMSFGSIGVTGPETDPVAEAYTNLVKSGVVMVVAAGNDGPARMTVDDGASAERVIAVGANRNSRIVSPLVTPPDADPVSAAAASNSEVMPEVTARLVDPEKLGLSIYGCEPYPQNSFDGVIALIQRGPAGNACTFAQKILNAQNAGAVAVLLFNNPEQINPQALVSPSVGAESQIRIGALFVGNADGVRLKDQAGASEDYQITLRFFRLIDPNLLPSFTSPGPAVNFAIKPDLVATGTAFYTASTSVAGTNESCTLCDPSGYVSTQGTSFSAPLVAGAAAVLKGARPELSADEIRSLLVNASSPVVVDGVPVSVQLAGAGRLQLENSIAAGLTANPVSLSFGVGGSTTSEGRILRLKNVTGNDGIWRLSVESNNEVKPAVSAEWMVLSAGEDAAVELRFAEGGLPPGAYEGFLVARRHHEDEDGEVPAEEPGDVIRIPYWYAVPFANPESLSVIFLSSNRTFFDFRLFDPSGVPLTNPLPAVTTDTMGASVSSVEALDGAPGTIRARIIVPFGGATFTIRQGDFSQSITIR